MQEYTHTHTHTDVHKWNFTPGVSEIAYYDAVIFCQKINIAPTGDYQSSIIHSQSGGRIGSFTTYDVNIRMLW